jgi:septal ring factor EnvC (AmiA/AmiB activator)
VYYLKLSPCAHSQDAVAQLLESKSNECLSLHKEVETLRTHTAELTHKLTQAMDQLQTVLQQNSRMESDKKELEDILNKVGDVSMMFFTISQLTVLHVCVAYAREYRIAADPGPTD